MNPRRSDAILLVAILLTVGLTPAVGAWHVTPEPEETGLLNPPAASPEEETWTNNPVVDRALEDIYGGTGAADEAIASGYQILGSTLNAVEDGVSEKVRLPITLFRDGAGGPDPDPADAREGGFGEWQVDGTHPWNHTPAAAYRGKAGYTTPGNEHGTYPGFARALLVTPELDLRTHALMEPRTDSGAQSMVLRQLYMACDLATGATGAASAHCLNYRDMIEQQELLISLEYRFRHNLGLGNDGVAIMVFSKEPSIQDAERCATRPTFDSTDLFKYGNMVNRSAYDAAGDHAPAPDCRIVLPMGGYSESPVSSMPGRMAYTGYGDWGLDAIDLTPWEGISVWVGFYFTTSSILNQKYFEAENLFPNSEGVFFGFHADDLVLKSHSAPVNLRVRPLLEPSQPVVNGLPTLHPDAPIPVRTHVTNFGATAVHAVVVTRILNEDRTLAATAPDFDKALHPGEVFDFFHAFNLDVGKYIAQVCAYRFAPGVSIEEGGNFCSPPNDDDKICTNEKIEKAWKEAKGVQQVGTVLRGQDALQDPGDRCIYPPGSCSSDPLNADPCAQLVEVPFEVRPLQAIVPGPIRLGQDRLLVGETMVAQVPIRNEGNRVETVWVQAEHVDLGTLERGQHLLPVEQRDAPVRVTLAPGEETTLTWDIEASGQEAQYRFLALVNSTGAEQPLFDSRYDLLPDVMRPWRNQVFSGNGKIDGILGGGWSWLPHHALGGGATMQVGNDDTHLHIGLTNVPASDIALFFNDGGDDSIDSGGGGIGVLVEGGKPIGVRYDEGWQLGLTDAPVVQVSAGGSHSLALLDDGSVYAWGAGTQGQLGNGRSEDQSTPQRVCTEGQLQSPCTEFLDDVVAVSAGTSHSLAVTKDGSVYAWGSGSNGLLGTGCSTSNTNSPVRVHSGQQDTLATHLTDIVAVSAGGTHSLAVAEDGSVYAWGKGTNGQLGRNSNGNGCSPVRVLAGDQGEGPLSDIVAVAAGDQHSLALTSEGAVYAWGDGRNGRLGDSNTDGYNPLPVRVAGGQQKPESFIEDIVSIGAGLQHSLAVAEDGSVYAWGAGANGRLGNGGTKDSAVPVRVVGIEDAVSVSAGTAHSLALADGGRAYAWGAGTNGRLGNGLQFDQSVPVRAGEEMTIVSAGGSHSLALRSDNLPFAWGAGANDRLGNGMDGDQAVPWRVHGLATFEDWGIQAGRSGKDFEISIPINTAPDAAVPGLASGAGDVLRFAMRFCSSLAPGGPFDRPCRSFPTAVPLHDGDGFHAATGDLSNELRRWHTLRLGDPARVTYGGAAYADVVAGPGFGVGTSAPPYLVEDFSSCPTFHGWEQQNLRGDWGGGMVDKWNCALYPDDGRTLLYKGLSPDSECDGICYPYAGDPSAPVADTGRGGSKFTLSDGSSYQLLPGYVADQSSLWSPPIELPLGTSAPTLVLAHQYSTNVEIRDSNLFTPNGTEEAGIRINHALNLSLERWDADRGEWVEVGPLEPRGGYATEESIGIRDPRFDRREFYGEMVVVSEKEGGEGGMYVDRDCIPLLADYRYDSSLGEYIGRHVGSPDCHLDDSLRTWWWWPQGNQPMYRPPDSLIHKGDVFAGGSPWMTDVVPLYGTHFDRDLNLQGETVRLRFSLHANERTDRSPDQENDWGWRIGGLAVMEGDRFTRDISVESAVPDLSYDPFEHGVGPGTSIPVRVTLRNNGLLSVEDMQVDLVGEGLRAEPGADPQVCSAGAAPPGTLEAGKTSNVTLLCTLSEDALGGLLALRASVSVPREDFLGNNQQRVRGHFPIAPSRDAAIAVDAAPVNAAAGVGRDIQVEVRNLGNVPLEQTEVVLEVLDVTDPSRPPIRVHREAWVATASLPVQAEAVSLLSLMGLDEPPRFVPLTTGTYVVKAQVSIPGADRLSDPISLVRIQASDVLYREDFNPTHFVDSEVMQGRLDVQHPDVWGRQPNNGPDGSPHLRAGDAARAEIPLGANATVELPPLDLATLRGATLSFQHRYDLESGFDAARVEMSVDGGETWVPLVPRAQPLNGLPEGHPSLPLVGANAILGDAVECFACVFTGSSEDLPGNRDGWVAAEYDLGRQSVFFKDAPLDVFSLEGMAPEAEAVPWSVGPEKRFLDETWVLDEPSAIDNQRYWWVQNITYSEPRPLTANRMWWSGSAGESDSRSGEIAPLHTTLEVRPDLEGLGEGGLKLDFWDWRAGWQNQVDDDRLGVGGVYSVSVSGQKASESQRVLETYSGNALCSHLDEHWQGLGIGTPASGTYVSGDGALNVAISVANDILGFTIKEGLVEAVIVHSGFGGNIYKYNPVEAHGDSGLVAPDGADMDQVQFCYLNFEPEIKIVERRPDGWTRRQADLTSFLGGDPITLDFTYISGSAERAEKTAISTASPGNRPWQGEVENNRGWSIDSLQVTHQGAGGQEQVIVGNDGRDAGGVQVSSEPGSVGKWDRVSLGASARDGGWHIGADMEGDPAWRFAADDDHDQGYPHNADSRLVTPVLDLRQYKGNSLSLNLDHRYNFHGSFDAVNSRGESKLGRAIDGGTISYQVFDEVRGEFGDWRPVGAQASAPEVGLSFHANEYLTLSPPVQEETRGAMGYPSVAGPFSAEGGPLSLGATFPASPGLLQSGPSFDPFPIAHVFSGDSKILYPETDGWSKVDWDISHLVGKKVRFAFHAWTNPSIEPCIVISGFGLAISPEGDTNPCVLPMHGWTISNVEVRGQQFQGESAKIRFRVATDGSMPKGEWSIDDILVVGQRYEQSVVIQSESPRTAGVPGTEVTLEGVVRNVGSAPRTGLALAIEAVSDEGGPVDHEVLDPALDLVPEDQLPPSLPVALGPFDLADGSGLPVRIALVVPEGTTQLRLQVLEDVGGCDPSGTCQTRYVPARNEQGAGVTSVTWVVSGEERTHLRFVPPEPDRPALVVADPPVPAEGQEVTLDAILHNNGTTAPEVTVHWSVLQVLRKGCPTGDVCPDQPHTGESIGQTWVEGPTPLVLDPDEEHTLQMQFTPPSQGLYRAVLEVREGTTVLDQTRLEFLAGEVDPYYLIDFAQTSASEGGWTTVDPPHGQSPDTIGFRQVGRQFLWGVTPQEFIGGKDYCDDGGCRPPGGMDGGPPVYGLHSIAQSPRVDLGLVAGDHAVLALQHGHGFAPGDGSIVEALPLRSPVGSHSRAAFQCMDGEDNAEDTWFRLSPVEAEDLRGMALNYPEVVIPPPADAAQNERPYTVRARHNPLGEGPVIGGQPGVDEEVTRFLLHEGLAPVCPPDTEEQTWVLQGPAPSSLLNYTLHLRLRVGTVPGIEDTMCNRPPGCPDNPKPRPGSLGWQVDSIGITSVDVQIGPDERELPLRDGFPKRFNLVVQNKGPLEETFSIGLGPDDRFSADPSWFAFPTPQVTLAPGASRFVPFEVNVPSEPRVERGPYTANLRATSSLDPNLFSEAALTLDLGDNPLPDLSTVLDIQAETRGQPPEPGKLAHIVTTVHNDGQAPAERVPVRVEAVHLDETGAEVGRSVVGTFNIPPLDPDEDVTQFAEWVPRAAGLYRIEAVADPDGRLVESRLANSRASALVEVVPLQRPDVRVAELRFEGVGEDGYALEGGLVTIVANITNRGTVAATGAQVFILAGSAQLLEVTLDSLAPGAYREVTALRVASPGEAMVRALVIPGFGAGNQGDSEHELRRVLRVRGIELALEPEPGPVALAPGATATTRVDVHNTGNAVEKVLFSLGPDHAGWGIAATPNPVTVAPGSSAWSVLTLQAPPDAVAGRYDLTILAAPQSHPGTQQVVLVPVDVEARMDAPEAVLRNATAPPGPASLPLRLESRANVPQDVVLVLAEPAWQEAPHAVTLAPGMETLVDLPLVVPAHTPPGEVPVRVAVQDGSGMVLAEVDALLNVTAHAAGSAQWTGRPTVALTNLTARVFQVTLNVSNDGNVPFDVEAVLSRLSEGVEASAGAPARVTPGASVDLPVEVRVSPEFTGRVEGRADILMRTNITPEGPAVQRIAVLDLPGLGALPDLAITDLLVSPRGTVAANEPVHVTVVVENLGFAESPATTLYGYVNGEAVGAYEVEPLAEGGRTRVNLTWAFPSSGGYIVHLVADGAGNLTELHDDNNGWTQQVDVEAGDLLQRAREAPAAPVWPLLLLFLAAVLARRRRP